jgi:hypothetical protein
VSPDLSGNKSAFLGRFIAVVLAVCTVVGAVLAALTFLGVSVPNPFSRAQSVCQGMVIPSYFSPGSLWTQAIGEAPHVAMMIANPNSGPGTRQDSDYMDYVDYIRVAQHTEIQVLGYVDTNYGRVDPAEVKREVDEYRSLYSVTDIFFDRVSEDVDHLAYYRDIANYVHGNSGATVVLNPGTYPDESYMRLADAMVVFDDTYASYTSPGYSVPHWMLSYPASKFIELIHAAPNAASMVNALRLSQQHHVGYVYVTDGTDPDPWNDLASYQSNELSQIANTCASAYLPHVGGSRSTRRYRSA